jgi:hypothetical protein
VACKQRVKNWRTLARTSLFWIIISLVFAIVVRCMAMLCKSNNCSARLVALHTPKWCLLAVYHFFDRDAEVITLQILEDLREEAFSR